MARGVASRTAAATRAVERKSANPWLAEAPVGWAGGQTGRCCSGHVSSVGCCEAPATLPTSGAVESDTAGNARPYPRMNIEVARIAAGSVETATQSHTIHVTGLPWPFTENWTMRIVLKVVVIQEQQVKVQSALDHVKARPVCGAQ